MQFSSDPNSDTDSDSGFAVVVDFVDLTRSPRSPIFIDLTADSDDESPPKRRCMRSDSSGSESGSSSPPRPVLGPHGDDYDSSASGDEDSDDYYADDGDADDGDADEWRCDMCGIVGIEEREEKCPHGNLCAGCFEPEFTDCESSSESSDSDLE